MHDFGVALLRHVTGIPDTDGLIQSIRPAQGRFRQAIRATAPNFRPFERKYERTHHLGRATFLDTEEADPCDGESSDVEPDDYDGSDDIGYAISQLENRSGKFANRNDKIYIDEVLERANKYV